MSLVADGDAGFGTGKRRLLGGGGSELDDDGSGAGAGGGKDGKRSRTSGKLGGANDGPGAAGEALPGTTDDSFRKSLLDTAAAKSKSLSKASERHGEHVSLLHELRQYADRVILALTVQHANALAAEGLLGAVKQSLEENDPEDLPHDLGNVLLGDIELARERLHDARYNAFCAITSCPASIDAGDGLEKPDFADLSLPGTGGDGSGGGDDGGSGDGSVFTVCGVVELKQYAAEHSRLFQMASSALRAFLAKEVEPAERGTAARVAEIAKLRKKLDAAAKLAADEKIIDLFSALEITAALTLAAKATDDAMADAARTATELFRKLRSAVPPPLLEWEPPYAAGDGGTGAGAGAGAGADAGAGAGAGKKGKK